MDSVKRRLVYVADENEVLFDNLTGGTPPTPRPSRLSKIHVTPSSAEASQQRLSAPAPLPVGTATVAAKITEADSNDVDPLLLVSYDGHLLADGSGTFHKPRNAIEASHLRVALHKCRVFLRAYVKVDTSPDPATPQSSSTSGSPSASGSEGSHSENEGDSTYLSEEEEEEDDGSENGGDDCAAKAKKKPATHDQRGDRVSRKRAREKAPGDDAVGKLFSFTVVELKEKLREAGLPITGNKATLIGRLQSHNGDGNAEQQRREETSPTSVSSQNGHFAVRENGGGDEEQSESPRAGDDNSTQGRLSERFRSTSATRSSLGGLWGTIVNVGSLFFRPSAAHAVRPPSAAKRAVPDNTH